MHGPTIYQHRCCSCGRFISIRPGVSWGQSWSYDMDGTPNLHDPLWHCAECTDAYGPPPSNCTPEYQGVIEAVQEEAQ